MTIAETMRIIKEKYEENVKPHLEKGNIRRAAAELCPIFSGIPSHSQDPNGLSVYNGGLNFLVSAEMILADFRQNRMPSKFKIQRFETYLAKACLSTEK